MTNHGLPTYTSVVSVIFYCYIVQSQQNHRHSFCSVASHFKTSLIIHEKNTKEITSVTEVLNHPKTCVDLHKF